MANQPTGLPAALSPDALKAKMKLTPQKAQQLNRIEVAGMKIMFAPQSHQLVVGVLQGPGPVSQKLGKGVAGLLGLLVKESKNSLPPDLLVPAGILLVAHAAEFLAHGGIAVSTKDFGDAVDLMQTLVLHTFGLDANKIASYNPRQATPGGPLKAPARMPPGGAPGQGLISGQMGA